MAPMLACVSRPAARLGAGTLRRHAPELLELAGVVLVAGGLWALWQPAGWFWAGVAAVGLRCRRELAAAARPVPPRMRRAER